MAKKRKTASKKSQPRPAYKAATQATRNLNQFSPKNIQPMEKIMNKSKTQLDQMANDTAAMSREASEAMMKSAGIFAKGFEEIMRTGMALAQNAAEKQAEFLKQVMAAKSPNEFTEIQNKAAQKSYDEFMANAAKISEMSVRTLTESAEPINNQINKAVQKASQAMAA